MSNEWYKRLIEAEAELNKYKRFFDYIESLIKTYEAVIQKHNPSINKIHDYNNALIHDIRNALEDFCPECKAHNGGVLYEENQS